MDEDRAMRRAYASIISPHLWQGQASRGNAAAEFALYSRILQRGGAHFRRLSL